MHYVYYMHIIHLCWLFAFGGFDGSQSSFRPRMIPFMAEPPKAQAHGMGARPCQTKGKRESGNQKIERNLTPSIEE